MIRILGDDGTELASGVINHALDPVVLVVDRVISGKGRLLQYYFGQGRRHVVADLGDFRLRGNLRTRWQDGERRWEIRLRPASRDSADASRRLEDVSPMT
jgi:hypothetical protein